MRSTKRNANDTTLCISRGRMCAHIYTHHDVFRAGVCTRTYTRIMQKGKGEDTHRIGIKIGIKNSGNTEKSCTKFLCTKAKNRKNIRERRKQRHQSIVKAVIFSYSIRENTSKIFHCKDISGQTSRHFLCFPFVKRRFPPGKTYVSRKENVRLPYRKHGKHKEKRELSP